MPGKWPKVVRLNDRFEGRVLIQITVNDQPHQVQPGTTVAGLLPQLGINTPAIAVEINQQLCPRDQMSARTLCDGDRLEVVTLVGGG